MGKFEDLTGRRFGRLTVIGVSSEVYVDPKLGYKYKKWDCICDCGKVISVRTSFLKRKDNYIRSCGCQRMKHMYEASTTHGESGTRLHKIWKGMKKRCYNNRCRSYKDYGGRGITVCDEWLNDFMAFRNWSLQNGYADDLSIDRIDVNSNYCPENCRWATDLVQANNSRHCHWITYNGKTQSLSDWAREYNIKSGTLESRLNTGWDIEEALLTPINFYKAGQRKKVNINGTSS